jgi:uncharacterized protein YbbC (DUF1343 family)
VFSFRTTSLFEQQDRVLSKGRLAVLDSPTAWYPEIESYLWEIIAGRGRDVVLLDEGQLSTATLAEKHIDAVIIERQGTGDCFDPFYGRLFNFFRESKEAGSDVPVYILDRPNPCGRAVEGSFKYGMCHKHGLTLAEMANMFFTDLGCKFPLHVISADATMAGRDLLTWSVPASDDFAGYFTAYFRAGQYLWNATNVSCGIGTERPYEFFGAPFMKDFSSVEAAYNKGVFMRRATFTPRYGLYSGEKCFGYQLLANPTEPYNSVQHAIRLIKLVKDSCEEFALKDDAEEILGEPLISAYFNDECSWEDLKEQIKQQEQRWLRKAKKYLLYPEPLTRIK